MNLRGQERREVGSHLWYRPPNMGQDHDGMKFWGESWCYSVNPKSLRREFSAPDESPKLKKMPLSLWALGDCLGSDSLENDSSSPFFFVYTMQPL